MITLDDYLGVHWNNPELTDDIRKEAQVLLQRVNLLLTKYRVDTQDYSNRKVTSGWRPSAYNARVKNAAKRSNHILGRAIDLQDSDGRLDKWLHTPIGTQALVDCELWHEHERDTQGWCHVQSRPPASGVRHFYAR